MADFRTHITVSTATGVAYGLWGYVQGAPLETNFLAAGLCSVSGMLPDLDSDSGTPAKEFKMFFAAVVPALLIDRFKSWGWPSETIVLMTAGLYLFIRFGLATLFKRITVHRGMWHSIPALAIAGLLAFLMVHRENLALRYFLAFAVMLGFFSHLFLDEIWSINFSATKIGLKSSYGTALKFFSDSLGANLFCYGCLSILIAAVVGDPMVMQKYNYEVPYNTPEVRREVRQYIRDEVRSVRDRFRSGQLPVNDDALQR